MATRTRKTAPAPAAEVKTAKRKTTGTTATGKVTRKVVAKTAKTATRKTAKKVAAKPSRTTAGTTTRTAANPAAKQAASRPARKTTPKTATTATSTSPKAAASRSNGTTTPPRRRTKTATPPVVDASAAEAPLADTPAAHALVADAALARTLAADAPGADAAVDGPGDDWPIGEIPASQATDFPQVPPVAPPVFEPSPPVQAWRPRRAVFIDVENTSSEASVTRVLDALDLRGLGATTELFAVGNWRVVAQGLARSLAERGAQLVHTAPASRVRDWSDLWIAVQAGIWLGRAHAGDAIDIVSHDKAFDAVGDAAQRLGVAFRRITYSDAASTRHAAAVEKAPASDSSGRRRGGRGGRGRGRGTRRPDESPTTNTRGRTAVAAPDKPNEAAGTDPHQPATPNQIQLAVARLTRDDPAAGVTIERLGAELRAAGFDRPPGSPRLVTRLKRLKDIEVLPSGWVRLARPDTASPPTEGEGGRSGTSRRSRRGGSRGRGRQANGSQPAADTTEQQSADPTQPPPGEPLHAADVAAPANDGPQQLPAEPERPPREHRHPWDDVEQDGVGAAQAMDDAEDDGSEPGPGNEATEPQPDAPRRRSRRRGGRRRGGRSRQDVAGAQPGGNGETPTSS